MRLERALCRLSVPQRQRTNSEPCNARQAVWRSFSASPRRMNQTATCFGRVLSEGPDESLAFTESRFDGPPRRATSPIRERYGGWESGYGRFRLPTAVESVGSEGTIRNISMKMKGVSGVVALGLRCFGVSRVVVWPLIGGSRRLPGGSRGIRGFAGVCEEA